MNRWYLLIFSLEVLEWTDVFAGVWHCFCLPVTVVVPVSKYCPVGRALPSLVNFLPPINSSPCSVCSQLVPIPSTENGKEELVRKESEESCDIISNLVLSHLVGIMYMHVCMYMYMKYFYHIQSMQLLSLQMILLTFLSIIITDLRMKFWKWHDFKIPFAERSQALRNITSWHLLFLCTLEGYGT